MIVRIATFASWMPEIESEVRRNLIERFKPALIAQPGFIAAYWATAEDGHAVSISVWESQEAMVRGGAAANATPLLPGQDPENIPAPARVETFTVFEQA
jgi:hypothetical protein